MSRLDPTNDFVFKQMLTRQRVLLADMLEGVFGRPVGMPEILDSDISGDRVGDKEIDLDIRAVLTDGSRTDVEMQARTRRTFSSRVVYYGARDYTTQLRRGEGYERLTPTNLILWTVEPLFPELERRHSIFELRERHTSFLFSDHLSIHLLQLSKPPVLSPFRLPRYDAQVERWARFFTAKSDAELEQLAKEDPIMHLAMQTLDEISQDPEVRRRALERQDAIKLYEIDLLDSRREGEVEGRIEGRVEGRVEIVLKQLGHRFGTLSSTTRARIEAATPEELDLWAVRVLTAATLDDVLAP